MSDKRTLRIISASVLAVLLIALFLPGEYSGRIAAAVLLVLAAAVCRIMIKKRSILSINKDQVLMIMGASSLVLLVLIYLTGFEFGFVQNPYALKWNFLLAYALPVAVIIAASEYIRYVVRAQGDRTGDVLSYIFCVIAECLTLGNLSYITSFNRFMDFVGITFFPALIGNLLYHYVSKRYGYLPSMIYRLPLSLYIYLIPVESGIPDAIMAIVKLFVPLAIYAFIDALYEKKRKYALAKRSKAAIAAALAVIVLMVASVMFISNQFRYGTFVIASPSMEGELNVGDAAIFERLDGQPVEVGQIIVFEKNGSVVIHRVVEIETVNGMTRYYTKGDANEDLDAGFVYISEIIGVVNHKIPYVGYPTIWLRSLFNR